MQFKGFHASAQVLVCVCWMAYEEHCIYELEFDFDYLREISPSVWLIALFVLLSQNTRVSQPFYLRNDLKHCTHKTVFKYETLSLIIICHVRGYLAGVINLYSIYFAYLYIYILHVFWIYILIHILLFCSLKGLALDELRTRTRLSTSS